MLANQYLVCQKLGEGGFGITYLAVDLRLRRRVAIKEYLPVALASRSRDGASVVPKATSQAPVFTIGLDKFVQEARALAGIKAHPNVVLVHSYFEGNDTAYLVMEYLEGETLAERILAEGALSDGFVRSVGIGILDGLTRIHTTCQDASPLLHRDIKPSNVFLTVGSNVKLIDFGAARQALGDASQAMTRMFTPGYAPPEQCVGGLQGPFTDIYAVGATLWDALVGRAPPHSLHRSEGGVALDSPADRVGADPTLSAVIMRALNIEAGERYQTAEAFRHDLAECLHLGPKAEQEAPRPQQAKPASLGSSSETGSRRQLKNAVKVAIAAAVVLAIIALVVAVDRATRNADDSGSSSPASVDSGPKIPEPCNLMLIHSYHKEYAWVQQVNQGLIEGLPATCKISEHYMDTKRHAAPDDIEHAGRIALETIEATLPDVVFLCDDDALRTVGPHLVGSEVRVVFLGINGDPSEYGVIDSAERPGMNMTGVLEREQIAGSFRLLKEIAPGVNTTTIISDDSSTAAPVRVRLESGKGDAKDLPVTIVTSVFTNNFETWKQAVIEAQSSSDSITLLTYHTVLDLDGNHIPPAKVLQWTLENSRLPEVTLWDFVVSDGALCSEAVDGRIQGVLAAQKTIRILRGEPIGELPLSVPQHGTKTINLARARHLGLQLPKSITAVAKSYDSMRVAPGHEFQDP